MVTESQVLGLKQREWASSPCRATRVLARDGIHHDGHTTDLDVLQRLLGALLIVKVSLVDLHAQCAPGKPLRGFFTKGQVCMGYTTAVRTLQRCCDEEVGGVGGRRRQHWQGRLGWLGSFQDDALVGDQARDHGHGGKEVAVVRALIDHIRDLRRDVERACAVNDGVQWQVLQARKQWSLSGGIASAHHREAIRVHRDTVDLDEGNALAAVLVVKVSGVQVHAELATHCQFRASIECLQGGVPNTTCVPARKCGVHGPLLGGGEIELGGIQSRRLGAAKAIELFHGCVKPPRVWRPGRSALRHLVLLGPLPTAAYPPLPRVNFPASDALLQLWVMGLPCLLLASRG
mmetsp:Transcript_115889/g.322675  ORF Transcript_115889/g.322675 Transcript_115889/m.322675 type:complete len:346 (+) Transcript_115889:474-1511(+)